MTAEVTTERLSGKAWSNFLSVQCSDQTRTTYTRWIGRFIKYTGAKTADGLLRLGSKVKTEDKIIAWLASMKDKQTATARIALSALTCFYDASRVQINKKFISKRIFRKPTKPHRSPERAEIAAVLNAGGLREKALILLLASSGIRIGAVSNLKLRHLRELKAEELEHIGCGCQDKTAPLPDGCRLLKVYEESPDDAYFTFLTPEAVAAVDAYLDYRKRSGEELTPNSPLIRRNFDVDQADKPAPCSTSALRWCMWNLEIVAGVHPKASKDKEARDRGFRHSWKTNHGFRAFCNTAMQNAKVHADFKQFLMGHDCKLDESYYDDSKAASVHGAYSEYLKAVDGLTVNDSARLQDENERLKERVGEIERLKAEMEKVKADLVELVRAGTKSGEIIPETKKE